MTEQTSDKRSRFLRLNPARTEKAVHTIKTLAQTGNRSNYEYTHDETRECFQEVEGAARELWEAFGLGDTPAEPDAAPEPAQSATAHTGPECIGHAMARAKLTRAMAYLEEDNLESGKIMLKGAIDAWDDASGET